VLGEEVSVVHPLVYNHPVVNDSVLCVHLGYMSGAIYIDDDEKNTSTEYMLAGSELKALKAEITRAFERDNERFVYAHKVKFD
jgi:sorbitol-specific phosphotransferase system component IIC